MAQDKEKNLFHNERFLKSILIKYIIPSVFAMFALFAGAITDTIIIGIFLGEDGLSAMSLISPVYLIYYTVGATVGIGGSIVASRYIGKRDYKKYRQIFSCAFFSITVIAIFITTLGLILLDPLANLLNGNSQYIEAVTDYLKFYIVGGGFTIISYIPLYFLKTDGRPQTSFWLFLTFSVLNVALTWLFLSPFFSMSIGGASLATSISMAVTTILGLFILFKSNGEIKLEKGGITFKNIKDIIKMGVPSGLANLLEALRNLLINSIILGFGFTSLLPTFTVVRNVWELLSALMLGISTTILSLVSVFHSEHDYKSIHKIFKTTMKIGIVSTLIAVILLSVFSRAIAGVFGITDVAVLKDVQIAIPLSLMGFAFTYINIQYTGYFNSIKRTGLSSMILSLRLVLYMLLSIFPLLTIFNEFGIWISFSMCEMLTTLTFLIATKVIRKKSKGLDKLLLDSKYQKEGDISFSVRNHTDDIMFAANKITDFCSENGIDAKRTMKTSLLIEEVLQIIIEKSLNDGKSHSIDIRVKKLEEEVMFRIRNSGKIFNILEYYEENKDNEELMEDLLGLKIVLETASFTDFKTTFGANNLLIIF